MLVGRHPRSERGLGGGLLCFIRGNPVGMAIMLIWVLPKRGRRAIFGRRSKLLYGGKLGRRGEPTPILRPSSWRRIGNLAAFGEMDYAALRFGGIRARPKSIWARLMRRRLPPNVGADRCRVARPVSIGRPV